MSRTSNRQTVRDVLRYEEPYLTQFTWYGVFL